MLSLARHIQECKIEATEALCSSRPLTSWPLFLLRLQTKMEMVSDALIKSSGARNLEDLEPVFLWQKQSSAYPLRNMRKKQADLFTTTDRLWNINEMMSPGYGFVWAANGNWNVISLCVLGRAVCVDVSTDCMTLQFSGSLEDCGWIITSVVVSWGKVAASPCDWLLCWES